MNAQKRLRLDTDPELVFEPYEYKEWLEGDGLRIQFKVQVPPEQTETYFDALLKSGGEYFAVTRERPEGQEDPKRMRFGGVDWSRHGDAGDKHLVNLVEDVIDDQSPSARDGVGVLLGQPQVKASLSHLLEYVKALVDLLEEKGIVDTTERERIDELANARKRRRRLDFVKVPDIDDLNR